LLFSKPDLSEWKHLTDTELFEAMGRKNGKDVNERIAWIRKIAKDISSKDESIYALIIPTLFHIVGISDYNDMYSKL